MPGYKSTATIAAPPQHVFERLDDQAALAAHMTKSSGMMGGGRMTYEFDAARGQAVGARIRVGGSAFGLKLSVDEVVTVRDPPRRKAWATTGTPRLYVMSAYRMGFELAPTPEGSELTVWIAYELPRPAVLGLVSAPLAGMYAHWCVDRMIADARALS